MTFEVKAVTEKPPMKETKIPGYSLSPPVTSRPPYQPKSLSMTIKFRGKKCPYFVIAVLFVGLLVATITLSVYLYRYQEELSECNEKRLPEDDVTLFDPIGSWKEFGSHLMPCIHKKLNNRPSIDLRCVRQALTKQRWHFHSVHREAIAGAPSLYNRLLLHVEFVLPRFARSQH